MPLTNNEIVTLIGSREAYQTSDDLMAQLMDDTKRKALFKRFLCVESDMSYDWFTDFFQDVYSDRKNRMQDYSPKSLAKLAAQITGPTNSHVDIAAGSMGLSISVWNDNPNAEFHAQEYGDSVLPFALFNMAIRNLSGTLQHGDSLHQEFKTTYRLTKGAQFSNIEIVDSVEEVKANTSLINPPYSMKWEHPTKRIPIYEQYGLAPKRSSDLAFLEQALDKLDEHGTLVAVMAQGILFRGKAEGKIRQKLIDDNLLDCVIGLPSDLFLKTPIAPVLVVLKKNRKSKDILFIDASEQCVKEGKYNVIDNEHQNKLIGIINNREVIDKLSNVVSLEEIQENDYNLNIPRYVDTFIEEEPVDLVANWNQLQQTEAEIATTNQELKDMMSQLVAIDPATTELLKEMTA